MHCAGQKEKELTSASASATFVSSFGGNTPLSPHLQTFMNSLTNELQKNKLPGVDVLINNAGISSRGYAQDTNFQVLQQVMQVNFYGPVGKLVVCNVRDDWRAMRAAQYLSLLTSSLALPLDLLLPLSSRPPLVRAALTNAIVETMLMLSRPAAPGPSGSTGVTTTTHSASGATSSSRHMAVGVISSVQGRLGIPHRSAYAASKHAIQGEFVMCLVCACVFTCMCLYSYPDQPQPLLATYSNLWYRRLF